MIVGTAANMTKRGRNISMPPILYHKTGDTEGEAFVYSRLGELELSLDNYKEAKKP